MRTIIIKISYFVSTVFVALFSINEGQQPLTPPQFAPTVMIQTINKTLSADTVFLQAENEVTPSFCKEKFYPPFSLQL